MSNHEKLGPEEADKVRFHFLKSNYFRTIHADGVFGGLSPNMNLVIAFYSERQPIPDQMVYLVNQDKTLGAEVEDERIATKGMVRELEANVVINVALAKELIVWLQDKIDSAEKVFKEFPEPSAITPDKGGTELIP